MTVPWWPAPASNGPLNATVVLPGSKSQTNRALLLGAISSGPMRIDNALLSRDTVLAARGLQQFGVSYQSTNPRTLTVIPPQRLSNQGIIKCGLAGTVLRFFPAIAAFGRGSVRFEGDPAAEKRPLLPLLTTLGQLGAGVIYHGANGFLPFTIEGIDDSERLPQQVSIDSSASSQFLSALLLASPLAKNSFRVQAVGALPSLPHIEMTIEMLAEQGVTIKTVGNNLWLTDPQRPAGSTIMIEPDLSNAGAFLAAALICGGTVRVAGWPQNTAQAGDAWRWILPQFGAKVADIDGKLSVTGNANREWEGVDLDLGQVGELAPTVAALCALAQTPSRLRGIGHLRGHETDRLAALAAEIRRAGGLAQITDDGLQIIPGPLRAADFMTYDDHRLATFATLLGLALPGSRVHNIETTAKTLPDFVPRWAAMLAGGPSPLLPSLSIALGIE